MPNENARHRPRRLLTRCIATVFLSLALQAGAQTGIGARAYVSNEDGEITVIDLSSLEIVSELVTQSKGPRGLGITASGDILVSANGDAGDISLIDPRTGELLARVPVGKNPEFVRVKGDFAFVTFEPASLGGPPPAPGSAEAMALEKEREDDDAEPARIAIIDLKQRKVIREITGGMETEGIEFSPDGKSMLVTNEADDNVSVHDVRTGKLLKRVSLKKYGHRPRGIKRSPDGHTYAVTLEFGNKLILLDARYRVRKVVETGEVPYGVAFDRQGKRLYVALSKGGALQVFDTKNYEEIGRAGTGRRCWHFTFTPDDSQILVACGRSNEIVVIDAKSLGFIKRIAGLRLPWGILTYPKSFGSLDAP